jgi:hypothetical protein
MNFIHSLLVKSKGIFLLIFSHTNNIFLNLIALSC